MHTFNTIPLVVDIIKLRVTLPTTEHSAFISYWITPTKFALQVKSRRIIASGVQCLIQFVNLAMTITTFHFYMVWYGMVWYVIVKCSRVTVNSVTQSRILHIADLCTKYSISRLAMILGNSWWYMSIELWYMWTFEFRREILQGEQVKRFRRVP